MLLLERLIDAIKEREGVVFGRLDAYVDRWREANPLPQWLRGGPIQARSTAADGLSGPRGAAAS